MAEKSPQRSRWVTVGLKILVGVTLASNLCIGSLIYGNLHSSRTVESQVDRVLQIREQLSGNLRSAIVALQDEFLSLPSFFRVDFRQQLITAIEQQFTIADRQLLNGRSAYSQLFSRKERRDISQLRPIVQTTAATVIVSLAVTDDDGRFTDSVQRLVLASKAPEQDGDRLRLLVEQVVAEAGSYANLAKKVADLSAKIADASLEAETTRNEILAHVEEIRAMEERLQATRLQQRHFTQIMGAAAVVINILVLFILIRFLVERPLSALTSTIEFIRLGQTPHIPYLKRKDQIGTLAGAIAHFRDALLDIRRESERKDREKLVIEDMFANLRTTIHTLDGKASSLVATADSLQNLAETTEAQAEGVARHAEDTAGHTAAVSSSATQQEAQLARIQQQIYDQNAIISEIIETNGHSRAAIGGLSEAIQAIHTIIGAVSDITDQTKLLALNATIEAARAGAAGKGFAVVASEVRQLSLKTDQATTDVMEKIKAIEQSSRVLFTHLDQIDERMASLNHLAAGIAKAVASQQQETRTVTMIARQTSDNTANVSRAMAEVTGAATKTRSLSADVHEISDQIASKLSELLKNATSSLEMLAAASTDSPPPGARN